MHQSSGGLVKTDCWALTGTSNKCPENADSLFLTCLRPTGLQWMRITGESKKQNKTQTHNQNPNSIFLIQGISKCPLAGLKLRGPRLASCSPVVLFFMTLISAVQFFILF